LFIHFGNTSLKRGVNENTRTGVAALSRGEMIAGITLRKRPRAYVICVRRGSTVLTLMFTRAHKAWSSAIEMRVGFICSNV